MRVLWTQVGSKGQAEDDTVQQKTAYDFVNNFDNPNLPPAKVHDGTVATACVNQVSGGHAVRIDP